MKIFALVPLLLCLSAVGACGAMVTIENAKGMSPAQVVMPIYQDADVRGGRILGLVEGHSCKNNAWDAEPTRAAADQQIRLQASRLGGDTIIAVRYEERGVTMQPNCWSGITAYGTVVQAKL
jgi:uncharacterized protein YbjQ (UPF0145 family)